MTKLMLNDWLQETSHHLRKMGLNDLPIYEEDKYSKRHWFVCQKLWTRNDINDEDKKMTQFVATLRK